MENSKLEVGMSHKRFLRPDEKANQEIIIPDIETSYGEDSLDIAVEYLNSLNN